MGRVSTNSLAPDGAAGTALASRGVVEPLDGEGRRALEGDAAPGPHAARVATTTTSAALRFNARRISLILVRCMALARARGLTPN